MKQPAFATLLAWSSAASLAAGFAPTHIARASRAGTSRGWGTPRIHAIPRQIVALTREEGKNTPLKRLLEERVGAEHVDAVELPCIATADAEDTARLPRVLSEDGPWEWIIVTSPEAAAVFSRAWSTADCPALSGGIACVGKATAKALSDAGLSPTFTPSKATGKVLAVELPSPAVGGCNRVLYPSSALAASTIAEGLEARGYSVTRLHSYTTVPAEWTAGQTEAAAAASVVAFGSPSAVEAWAARAGTAVAAACIGETSAAACRSAGFPPGRIFSPEKPGLDGWVAAVEEALTIGA